MSNQTPSLELDHTCSEVTLEHEEQASREMMSISESVLDPRLDQGVPDIGREVVATDGDSCYLEPELMHARYTLGGSEGLGVAWDALFYRMAALSNPDYTGMALLDRRSHHPDFTCGIKPQGQAMFAVVLGSNEVES